MESDNKFQIFIDKRINGTVQPDGNIGVSNSSDYCVTVNLNRIVRLIDDYIDVSIDETKISMDRQLINPYFIEFGFFNTIKSITLTSSTMANTFSIDQTIIDKSKIFDIKIN